MALQINIKVNESIQLMVDSLENKNTTRTQLAENFRKAELLSFNLNYEKHI